MNNYWKIRNYKELQELRNTLRKLAGDSHWMVRSLAEHPLIKTKTDANKFLREVRRGAKFYDRNAVIAKVIRVSALVKDIQFRRRRDGEVLNVTLGDRLVSLRKGWAYKIASQIKNYIGYNPQRGGVSVVFPGDGRINTCETEVDEQDEGTYSSRCTYHKVAYYLTVTCNPRNEVDHADGVTMILRPEQVRHGRVEVRTGWIITKGRGYGSVSIKPAVRVYDEMAMCYAHGDDLHKALSNLRRKIAAIKRKSEPITGETVITPAMYQRITGACDAGTNAWLEEHGFTRKDKMTARELLGILDDRDYGKSTLAALIAE